MRIRLFFFETNKMDIKMIEKLIIRRINSVAKIIMNKVFLEHTHKINELTEKVNELSDLAFHNLEPTKDKKETVKKNLTVEPVEEETVIEDIPSYSDSHDFELVVDDCTTKAELKEIAVKNNIAVDGRLGLELMKTAIINAYNEL